MQTAIRRELTWLIRNSKETIDKRFKSTIKYRLNDHRDASNSFKNRF